MMDYLRYMGFPMYAPNGVSGAAATTQNSDASGEADDTSGGDGDKPAPKSKTPAQGDTVDADDADNADQGDDEGTEEGSQDEDADASEAGKQLAKRKRTMRDRLNQVTGKFRDAERRAMRAEKAHAELLKKMRTGYDQDENPDLNYSLDKRKADDLRQERDDALSERHEARMDMWKERVSDFRETHKDFEKIAYTAPIGDETSELISDMEDGPAVAYELGKNHAEARRIDRLPASQKAFALGRIAERINAKPVQRQTQAPTPIKNGVSGSGKAGVKPKLENLTPGEYAKIVAAEEKRKYG